MNKRRTYNNIISFAWNQVVMGVGEAGRVAWKVLRGVESGMKRGVWHSVACGVWRCGVYGKWRGMVLCIKSSVWHGVVCGMKSGAWRSAVLRMKRGAWYEECGVVHIAVLWGVVCLGLGGVFVGCANPVQPQGGEKDTSAPQLMSIENTPIKGKTKIRLVFNENIQANAKVLASPIILNKNPTSDTNEIKKNIYRNTLTLTLPKHIETVYLNAFVKDLNEGNPIACPPLLMGKDSGEIFIRVLTIAGEKNTHSCFINQEGKIYLPEVLPNNIYHFSGMGSGPFYTSIIKNDNNNFLVNDNESYLVFYSNVNTKDTIVTSLYPTNKAYKTAYIDSLGNAMVVGVSLFYKWIDLVEDLTWWKDTLLVKKSLFKHVKNLLKIDTFFMLKNNLTRRFNGSNIVYRHIKTSPSDTLYYSPTNNGLGVDWWGGDSLVGGHKKSFLNELFWGQYSSATGDTHGSTDSHLVGVNCIPVLMMGKPVLRPDKERVQDLGFLQLENPCEVGVFFRLFGAGISFVGYVEPQQLDLVSKKSKAGTLQLLAPEGEYFFYSWINNTVPKENFSVTTLDAYDFKNNKPLNDPESFHVQQKQVRVSLKLQNTLILPTMDMYNKGIISN